MKRLYRSRTDRKVAGVLGGLSEYLSVDPTIIRIIFLVLLIGTGFFPMGLLYILSIFIIPNEEEVIKE